MWSYGVLLFEIFTRGQKPYPSMDNKEVTEQVTRGYRMPKPLSPDCTDPVYAIMLQVIVAFIRHETFNHAAH